MKQGLMGRSRVLQPISADTRIWISLVRMNARNWCQVRSFFSFFFWIITNLWKIDSYLKQQRKLLVQMESDFEWIEACSTENKRRAHRPISMYPHTLFYFALLFIMWYFSLSIRIFPFRFLSNIRLTNSFCYDHNTNYFFVGCQLTPFFSLSPALLFHSQSNRDPASPSSDICSAP